MEFYVTQDFFNQFNNNRNLNTNKFCKEFIKVVYI